MRHIFDQYDHPENRLTHALMSCLAQDERLLRKFLHWVVDVVPKGPLFISEQALPGEEEVSEDIAEKRGLPDAWIYSDEKEWALLIESKIASPWNSDQIRRHFRMAEKRNFKDVSLLALGLRPPKEFLGQRIIYKPWRDVYCWLCQEIKDSEWALRLREYFEIAEVRMLEDEYLKEETITKFAGIPFGLGSPYTYGSAKRILGLLMDEVSQDASFVKKMGVDLSLPSRPAKTGKDAPYIWDFLRVQESKGESDFTALPHLTFSIQNDKTRIQITVPHRAKKAVWNRLIALGPTGLEKIMQDVLFEAKEVLCLEVNAKPFIHLTQRHYLTQRSLPIQDADLWFDLRTIVKGKHREKYQPEWIAACCAAIERRRSNLQLGIGFDFSYRSCTVLKTDKAAHLIKESFFALRPILNALLERKQ